MEPPDPAPTPEPVLVDVRLQFEVIDEALKNKGQISTETLKQRLMQEDDNFLLANDITI